MSYGSFLHEFRTTPLRARYMDPSTGRFFNMDTYEGDNFDPVSLHKYLYANANPVMYIDPSGNYSLAETSTSLSIMSVLNSVSYSTVITTGLKLLTVLTGVIAIKSIVDNVQGQILGDIPSEYLGKAVEGLKQLEIELNRWKSSSDYKNNKDRGNHWIEVMGFSGLTKTPRVEVANYKIGKLNVKHFNGGKPGRIVQLMYRCGKNAGPSQGFFKFRYDYIGYHNLSSGEQPTIDFHYHLIAGPIKVNHAKDCWD